MNVLVIGCGRVGRQLATQLSNRGHEVSVIDSNPEFLESLGDDFEGLIIRGNPMDLNCLRNAGIEGCDAIAVVSQDDNLNITVSQIAKEFFGATQIITRVSEPTREDVFEHFGLRTICPTDIAAEVMYQAIMSDEKMNFVNLGSATLTFLKQPVQFKDVGKFVSQIETNTDEYIFGVEHKDKKLTLYDGRQRLKLQNGDILYLHKIVD